MISAKSTPSAGPALRIENLDKYYGTFRALRNVNLSVERGEKIVVCGPSGSGKSTMIRCINRLEQHNAGRITVLGTELNDDVANIDGIRREVGMVFQHFNLFPHMTVLENLTIAPMIVRKVPTPTPRRPHGATWTRSASPSRR
jgi:general L-amino acid transport system ATP-binding protein